MKRSFISAFEKKINKLVDRDNKERMKQLSLEFLPTKCDCVKTIGLQTIENILWNKNAEIEMKT